MPMSNAAVVAALTLLPFHESFIFLSANAFLSVFLSAVAGLKLAINAVPTECQAER
jgi:hypothetical protein